MKKRCEKCGKEFEARQSHFKYCPNCFSMPDNRTDLSMLLLKTYHDPKGNMLKEVYIHTPQELANIFAKDKPLLGTKQLREFHLKILKARNKALLKGIDGAKHILYECQKDLEYQLKRGIIPYSFAEFMKHHLALAERDEKSLDGFFQHLDSVVCYFPIK
jgi:CRISPR/Cas system CSM-associated protein Csm2 small subunit